MLEDVISYIGTLNVEWIYVVLFLFSFIENVFPPSPSDVIVVIGASLIASTSLEFIPVFVTTSVGSAMGFILMYWVGFYLREHVIERGKIRFISQEALEKTGQWFEKYGYSLILANRFLPGTRSVISFFSGVYELKLFKTFSLALISAFLWNAIIVYMGLELGNNVHKIDYYLTTYANIIGGASALIIVLWGIKYFINKRRSDEN